MKRVAIIGTVGVPAAYGGFETLVENIIGENASEDIEYTVFCSSKDCPDRIEEYKGAKLKYVALRANGVQSIIYDGVSMLKSLWGYDAVIVLGVSGGIFIPIFKLLSRAKLIVNIDGMEWKRAKWSGLAKKFLHFSERIAVRCANVVVADNQAIVDYVMQAYGKSSELIAYGGDHVVRELSLDREKQILDGYGVKSKEYSMSLCRIEPENNCEMILSAFARSGQRLLFVGNWDRSEYGRGLKSKYSKFPNINCIDAIYDVDVLYALRKNCDFYLHGHSAGGTNPSLVEAMFCGCNILAFDVVYNRETTESQAAYFNTENELIEQLSSVDVCNSDKMVKIANKRYRWSVIANKYESFTAVR